MLLERVVPQSPGVRAVLGKLIGQVLQGLWFDLSLLRKATLVQGEKAGSSQGSISQGQVPAGEECCSREAALAPPSSLQGFVLFILCVLGGPGSAHCIVEQGPTSRPKQSCCCSPRGPCSLLYRPYRARTRLLWSLSPHIQCPRGG